MLIKSWLVEQDTCKDRNNYERMERFYDSRPKERGYMQSKGDCGYEDHYPAD